MDNQLYTLIEMLSYGSLCAYNEEQGLFVTVNSEHLNLWIKHTDNAFEARYSRTLMTAGNGLYAVNGEDMQDQARRFIEDVMSEQEAVA